MQVPNVVVAVPTRNGAARIGALLSALARQSYPADLFDVLVVNNASTDATRDIVLRAAETTLPGRLRLVGERVPGVNRARNRAVAASSSELIAFIDDDELPPESWLLELVEGIGRHPQAACCGGPMTVVQEGDKPTACDRCAFLEGEFRLEGTERAVEAVSGGNAIFRRAAFASVGLFDPSLSGHGDDFEWMFRAQRNGWSIFYLPSVNVWHRRTAQRLGPRMSKAFRRAHSAARFEARVGLVSPRVWPTIRPLPRYLAHAARYRCEAGIVQASAALGRAAGALSRHLARDRRNHKVT
jgi:GT2 family glycosyltransferase